MLLMLFGGAHERHALATDPCAEDSLVLQGEEVFVFIFVVYFSVVVGWHCPYPFSFSFSL